MDKATKYYKRALTKYHNGYIDEAIYLCGASIAENNRYKAAASLKGVLFYFKGDLENARELWDFNVRANKDAVSQKYIDNTRFDDKFLSIYSKGIALINEVKIAEALVFLKQCEESDFNVINVSNHIATCLIKQGEFIKAKEYLDKVTDIDKKNKMALNNIKMLKKYGIIEKKFGHLYMIIFLIIAILGSGLSIYAIKIKKRGTLPNVVTKIPIKPVATAKPETTASPKISDKPVDKLDGTNPKETISEEIIPKEEKKDTNTEIFPYDNAKTYIDEEKYEELDELLSLWKDKNIDDKGKALLKKASELMSDKGVDFFYKEGYRYSADKDYKNAADYYYKVYTYGNVNYVYESALFYLASSKDNLGDTSESLKYYEQYSNDFPEGSYETSVLYALVKGYGKSDISKAKKFANMLSEKFPDSEYNNNYVKSILAK